MFVWNASPFSSWLSKKYWFFEKVFGCDLCFGVWVYTLFALFTPETNPLILVVDDWVFRPLLAMIVYLFISLIFGAVTSFIVHIFSLGWNARFQTIVIEDK